METDLAQTRPYCTADMFTGYGVGLFRVHRSRYVVDPANFPPGQLVREVALEQELVARSPGASIFAIIKDDFVATYPGIGKDWGFDESFNIDVQCADSDCSCPVGSEEVTPCTTAESATCRCIAGYAGTGRACTACAAGVSFAASPGESQCTSCNSCASAGRAPGGTPCTPTADATCLCAPGYAGDGITCTECVSGNFKADAATGDCTAHSGCPGVGRVVLAPGSTTADDTCTCDAGYEPSTGDACVACASGEFKSTPGLHQCEVRNPCTGTGEAILVEGNTLVDNTCLCTPGFAPDGSGGCVACNDGVDFSDASDTSPCRPCEACAGTGTLVVRDPSARRVRLMLTARGGLGRPRHARRALTPPASATSDTGWTALRASRVRMGSPTLMPPVPTLARRASLARAPMARARRC